MTTDFSASFLVVFTALMPIINPPGTALLFLAITRRASRELRHTLARKIAINSIFVILPSMYFGAFVLRMFGISIPVLRLAGGLVLAAAGWRMLNAPSGPDADASGPDTLNDKNLANLAFYPLTLPLTAGPGTISVSIAIGSSQSRQLARDWGEMLSSLLGGLTAVGATALAIYLCYRYADRIQDTVGEAVSEALARVFAFILICLGVQILWNGFAELWMDMLASRP
ncbi:MAG: MarC family protein [Moraxellaceae bacterium]|nr:MarC family protein [Moraxellaceae bacterium]